MQTNAAAENPTSTENKETHAFQTEVQQLLHLIIHSLYSNKEIFLRELISNASDACDRLRFVALTDTELREDGDELAIWIALDANKKTLSVRDNGIGMSHAEVIENIGTIARSGTRKFVQQMNETNTADGKVAAAPNRFIGQFGVGFYSAFLVAREVTVLTRAAGAKRCAGVKWVSTGSGAYTVETIERAARGTEIILQLQDEAKEYVDPYRVRTVIGKYSDHISLPIRMQKAVDPAAKGIASQPPQWESVTQAAALWARPKNEISAAEHHAFYTSLTYDPLPPAITLHNRVEGKLEYISLFYIAAKAPFDLWDREQRHAIKLYVRRIFVADDARQLMPNYLRFVRGLVDAADLPLNVSREFLQHNQDLTKIRAASIKKVLGELKKIAAKDAPKYAELWAEYGRVLKEGVIEDVDNRTAIVALLRFASTHADDEKQTVSLQQYCHRMPHTQKAIYYLTADNYAAAKSSPQLEVFRKNATEVLLLSDSVDEWVVGHLPVYADKPLQSIAKGELDAAELAGPAIITTEPNAGQDSAHAQSLQPLLDAFATVLAGQVKDVRLSARLVDSPACLVADSHDPGANLQRILHSLGQDAPPSQPILEINPHHPLITQLDAHADSTADWARVLFDQAALAEGAMPADAGGYVKRINKLLMR